MPDRISPSERGVENRTDQGNDIAVTRSTLRCTGIAAREALSADEHLHLSTALDDHLRCLLQRCRPRILGFCWPIRGEFDCRPLAAHLIERGVHCCLPRVTDGSMTMTFHAWHPGSAMEVDRHGIPTPSDGAPLLPDMLLIPVNVFDTVLVISIAPWRRLPRDPCPSVSVSNWRALPIFTPPGTMYRSMPW